MSGDTRTKLLQAAERILIEEGVTALTMRRVGDVSGINPTLITYHYGTVAALLATLLDHNLNPMFERWELIEAPVPPGADPLDTLLGRWLRPLLSPACYNPEGRALIVLDEIAAHGERETAAALVAQLATVGERLAQAVAPFVPELSDAELRLRLRFIGGAALGPPPRARLTANGTDLSMGEPAVAAMIRFARAALGQDEESLAQSAAHSKRVSA